MDSFIDKSYFSDTEEDQAELVSYLINNIFDVFSILKLEKLSDFIVEKKLKNLIFEM